MLPRQRSIRPRTLLCRSRRHSRRPPRKLVGFEVTGRGIARHGYPVLVHDERVGEVTSGTYAPFLQKNIGLCYVPAARAAVGTELGVEIRGQLWAQPVPLELLVRTEIDLETGNVEIADLAPVRVA